MKLARRSWLLLVMCSAAALATGCGATPEGEEDDDELAVEEGELTTALEAGAKVATTAKLNMREGPSLNHRVIRVLPKGTTVTLVDGEPENKFYEVKLSSGATGYCHGAYLRETGGAPVSTDPGTTAFPTSGDIFRSRGTGYYPANNSMEGGFFDRKGKRLRTLQGYLSGQHEYVSVAMDTNAFPYGTKLRIKELERKYGRRIEFRVVDTGGAFRGRGRSRIDICTNSRSATLDPTINGMLTIAVDR